MEESNAPIFAQAKVEYTKQLIDVLKDQVYKGFRLLYDEAKNLARTKEYPIVNVFRELLTGIPKWNQEVIERETNRITTYSKCDWLEDLITAVYISHTKILASLGPNKTARKINLTIPKTNNFIHKCYICIARELWKNPFLFDETISGHEYQRNIRSIEIIIKECIEQTIRTSLPVRDILRNHLDTQESIQENDDVQKTQNMKDILLQELLKERKYGLLQDRDIVEGNELIPEEESIDYREPTESEIIKNTSGLEVNDKLLTEVDIMESEKQNVVEPVYENVNIIDNKKDETEEKLKEIINGEEIPATNELEPRPEIIIETAPPPVSDTFDTDSTVGDYFAASNMFTKTEKEKPIFVDKINEEPVIIEQIDKDPVIIVEKMDSLAPLPEANVATVEKKEDDTITLDNFLNDVSEMTNTSKEEDGNYTLFDDIN